MRRLAIQIVVFAALGLATTIGIAWTVAINTDFMGAPRYNRSTGAGMHGYYAPEHQTVWIYSVKQSWGVIQINAGNYGLEPPGGFDSMIVQRQVQRSDVPSWTVMRRGDSRGIFNAHFIEQGFGYPCLALSLQHRWTRTQDALRDSTVDGLLLPGDLQQLGRGHWLPLRPIWSGFALNSLIFGWIWYSLFAFPAIIVRSVRRHRGVCQSCGYDLRGIADQRCPECGKAARP